MIKITIETLPNPGGLTPPKGDTVSALVLTHLGGVQGIAREDLRLSLLASLPKVIGAVGTGDLRSGDEASKYAVHLVESALTPSYRIYTPALLKMLTKLQEATTPESMIVTLEAYRTAIEGLK